MTVDIAVEKRTGRIVVFKITTERRYPFGADQSILRSTPGNEHPFRSMAYRADKAVDYAQMLAQRLLCLEGVVGVSFVDRLACFVSVGIRHEITAPPKIKRTLNWCMSRNTPWTLHDRVNTWIYHFGDYVLANKESSPLGITQASAALSRLGQKRLQLNQPAMWRELGVQLQAIYPRAISVAPAKGIGFSRAAMYRRIDEFLVSSIGNRRIDVTW